MNTWQGDLLGMADTACTVGEAFSKHHARFPSVGLRVLCLRSSLADTDLQPPDHDVE